MKIVKIFMLLFALHASSAWAKSVLIMPEPPAQNPHAPTSIEDRRRVDFAVAQIRAKYGPNIEIRHPHIVPWSFQRFEQNRKANLSSANPTGQPPPPVSSGGEKPGDIGLPALKEDEFVVHAYVRDSANADWRHLDVILTEDRAGQLSLRGFLEAPMIYDDKALQIPMC